MDQRARKLLFDAVESARSIREWCAGRSFAEYEADRQFRRAVEREFEIIGEALNRLRRVDEETAARISELDRIIGFRNRIIHGYDNVDDALVWGITQEHLAKLVEQLESELKRTDEGDPG